MKVNLFKRLGFHAAVALIGCFPAGAVIVAGTSGTGNNNNSQAGLDSYLSGAPSQAFPHWNNLVRVADASGIYLGFNASTQRGWVLSANHVTTPTVISVAGGTYTVTGTGTQIGSSDLKLYEIGGGLSDPTLPSLAAVPLASTVATSGESVLMFGRGFTNDVTAPYSWEVPGTNDANVMRWGTNTIELVTSVNIGTELAPNLQPYLITDFDASGDPGVTEFDAQASVGDSGGGMFVLRGGVWQVAGIAHFVDDGPDFNELVETGDGVVDPSEIGDFSGYSDVASKFSQINAITGTLIPEPSSILLAFSSLVLLARRRR